jgi:outer membrane protein OmpA-like peptidoglycan-associated protein
VRIFPPRRRTARCLALSTGPHLVAALIASAALLPARRAEAQATYFYLDRAQLSGAPDDGFMVWRPHLYEQTRFYGFAALGYSHNPLRNDTVARTTVIADQIDNPVQGQFISYFHLGTEIANRFAFNLAVPVLLLANYGDDPIANDVGTGGIGDTPTTLHDIRLDGRVKLHENDTRKLRIGAGGAIFADTGDSSGFASDDTTTVWLYGSGEYDFGKFFVAGMLGPHFRPEITMGGTGSALIVADELRWAFGGYYPMRDGRVRLGVELWGSTGITKVGEGSREHGTTFNTRNFQLEWLGQARFLFGQRQRTWLMGGLGTRLSAGYGAPDFRMLVSIGHYLTLIDFEPKSPGPQVKVERDWTEYKPRDRDQDGYPDDIDQCPDVKEDGKEPDPSDGCPTGSDRDKDGIPDDADACPDVAEDKDGVADHDGCPEQDADEDKVPDTEDKCPTEKGPRSSIAEKNGCPLIKEIEGEVQLLEPIQFEFGKAAIKPVSYPILDEVVKLMQSREKMRIGVYGHTDNVGADATNLRLSKDRAAAVMAYLIGKGINKGRLESQGYGETKPVESNDTDAGRAKNRRVEFKILGGDDD